MRFLPIFALALALTACKSSPTSPGEPTMVTLAPGQSVTVNGLVLKFIGVTMDSRCPADAQCVQAGDAAAAIETWLLGAKAEVELMLRNTDNRSTTRGRYVISFDTLAPYPLASRAIPPADYRAGFLISVR